MAKVSISTAVNRVKKVAAQAKTKKTLAANPVTAVRLGSVSENALIYLKDGVDGKISELQVAIATREAAKKSTLAALTDLEDLESDCSMSDIRQRLNTTVTALVNLYNAM